MLLTTTLRSRGLQALAPALCSSRVYGGDCDLPQENAEPSTGHEVIYARRREDNGTRACNKLRRTGRTPAILFSLPFNESQLISLDTKQVTTLVRHYGRSGLVSRLFDLHIEVEDRPTERYTVLPRMVHRSAVTDVVENITLMHCPPDRTVKVPVPVQLMGEDMAPGIKKGGYLNLTRRRLDCVGLARLIPRTIEVDVSALDFGQRIYVSSLQLPSGVSIVGKVMEEPLCKLGGRAAKS